jgi:phage FluMu protein Com
MQEKLKEIRCGQCQRKLAEGEYVRLNIKCPRCGALNVLRALSPTPERPGASLVESNNGKAQKRSNAH